MKTKLGATLLGFSYMTLGLIPAYADDTDIFLGKVREGAVRPNVLFILDNSSSMTNRVGDYGTPTRLESMKDSMISILNSVEGINAGFMRFNDPGGSILYPVSDLDEPMDQFWKLRPTIEESSDDAMQSLSGVGAVELDGSEITLGAMPTNIQTRNYSITANADDAAERTSGTVATGDNPLQVSSARTSAFRFTNVDIPPQADILSAQIQFRSRRDDSSDLDLVFNSHLHTNSPALSTSNSNISTRALSTSSVTWSLGPWSNGEDYLSPDLSPLIREVVGQAGWASGNALSIIQSATGSGNRRIASRETSSSQAAKLTVQFQASGEAYIPQQVGLRFASVSIPRGATIKRAYLQLTSSATRSSESPLQLSIRIQDSLNPPTFSDTGITGLSTMAGYSIDWDTGGWEHNEIIQTPSLVEPLQALVNDPNWCGGNAVAFHIVPRDLNQETSRSFYSADDGTGAAPRLIVEYDRHSVPENTCNQVTLSYPISGQPNDAQEYNNSVVNNGNTLELRTSRLVGLRFEDLPIRQGATVTDARIVFTAADSHSGDTSITFKVEDSVAAPNFPQSNGNISNRTLRNESVTWNSSSAPVLGSWVQNNKYRSPDISSIINPLIQDANWNSEANALAFVIESTGQRAARSRDWGAGGAAVLELKINVADITADLPAGPTVRDHLKDIVTDLDARTYTPIVDTLYEAALYYRGDNVYWGRERWSGGNTQQRYKRVSHEDSIIDGPYKLDRPANCSADNLNSTNCVDEQYTDSPRYESPITQACQANYIVLLTDGAANNNNSASMIRSLTGDSSCESSGSTACSHELVEWMANNDINDNVEGENTVQTFTIAFALNDSSARSYLENLAQKGGGRHFTANSAAELTNAFNSIIGEIIDRNATFVVPGATVSQFNRLTHHEDIFFSVFKPARTPRWAGNLKKYKIAQEGNNFGRIVGQNNQLAVDPNTGFFKENVTSFWSDTNNPDGPAVEKGGAASKLNTDPTQRKVLTYYTGASTNLTAEQNRISPDNANLTKARLGITERTDDYHRKLLRWARGEDVFDENNDGSTNDGRLQFGDPLHSAPVPIPYGGTADDPEISIFFGTNDGFLRAINGSTGQEHFAFIPEALLPNLQILYDNAASDAHPYGVDGDITRWVHDSDGDPTTPIGELDDDFAYIYFGLRRGGNHYYALDVTDPDNPKLMWHLNGADSPYHELGQTWSQPLKARVQVKEDDVVVAKDVLIFGGGYDDNQDAPDARRRVDSKGRAIFMVEAGYPTSGTAPARVWSAGPSVDHHLQLTDMKYGIPSIVRAGDTNGDGYVDVMFAADMGGQIWRFDVNNGQPAASLVTGGVIASLAGDTPADGRRFYGGVDAATIAYRGERFIAITAGSGWRANPLDKVVEDRFYMIRQPIAKPLAYTAVTEADLYDATDDLVSSTNEDVAAQAREDMAAKPAGWYIKLEETGEKVLAPPVTAQAVVHFTTYRPDDQSDPCNPSVGKSYFWAVNVNDATPALFNNSGTAVRNEGLESGNIAPSPTFIILPDGTPVTLVGPEEMGPTLFGDPVHKTYWFENQ